MGRGERDRTNDDEKFQEIQRWKRKRAVQTRIQVMKQILS